MGRRNGHEAEILKYPVEELFAMEMRLHLGIRRIERKQLQAYKVSR